MMQHQLVQPKVKSFSMTVLPINIPKLEGKMVG